LAHFEELDPFYVKALDEQRELDRLVSAVEHKPHNSIEPRKHAACWKRCVPPSPAGIAGHGT
jgi:hypothetical protein